MLLRAHHHSVPVPMCALTSSRLLALGIDQGELGSALAVAVVAVLQFQNRLYESQKLTQYLYINIEVFFRVWE